MGTRRISAKQKQWISASFWTSVFQLITRGSSFVVFVVLAAVLPVRVVGALLAVQAIAVTIGSVWDFGTGSYISRQQAAGVREGYAAYVSALRYRYRSLWLLALVSALLCYTFRQYGNLTTLIFFFGLSVISSGLLPLPDGVLRGSLDFRAVAQLRGTGRAASVFIALLMWVNALPRDAAIAAVVLALPDVWYVVTATRRVHSHSATTVPDEWRREARQRSVKVLIRESAPFGINAIAVQLYNRLDIYLVSIYLGTVAAGIYSPASKLQDVLSAIPLIFTAGAIPLLTRTFTADGPQAALADTRRIARISTSVTVSVAVVTIGVVVIASRLYPTNSYIGNPTIAILGVASVIPIAANSAYGSYLVAVGRASALSVALVATLILSTVLTYIAAKLFGVTGAAVVVIARECVVFVLLVLAIRRSRPEDNRRDRTRYVLWSTSARIIGSVRDIVMNGVLALLAVAAGALLFWRTPTLELTGLVVGLIVRLLPSGTRAHWILLIGALVSFQSPYMALKLAYVGAVAAVAIDNSFRPTYRQSERRSRSLITHASLCIAYTSVVFIYSAVQGRSLNDIIGDSFPYFLVAILPLVAAALPSLSHRHLLQMTTFIVVVAPLGWVLDWIHRRSGGEVGAKFVLSSFVLLLLVAAIAVYLAAKSRFLMSAIVLVWVLACGVSSGTRSSIILLGPVIGGGIFAIKRVAVATRIFAVLLVAPIFAVVLSVTFNFLGGSTSYSPRARLTSLVDLLTGQSTLSGDASYLSRAEQYQVTSSAIANHPAIGSGFGVNWHPLTSAITVFTSDTPLITVAKLGIVGTLLFASFIARIVIHLLAASNSLAAKCSIAAFSVGLLVLLPFNSPLEDKGLAIALAYAFFAVQVVGRHAHTATDATRGGQVATVNRGATMGHARVAGT